MSIQSEIETKHGAAPKEHLTDEEMKRQRDDITYARYVDEWENKAQLHKWMDIGSAILSSIAQLPKEWLDNQNEFSIWLIARIWPERYPPLENAMLNYRAVSQDLSDMFTKHGEASPTNNQFIRIKRLHSFHEGSSARYRQLVQQYDQNVSLVRALFYELTRAANYICDHVREFLLSSYRVEEGVLLIADFEIQRWEVRFLRLEYRGENRTELPYEGLDHFIEAYNETRNNSVSQSDTKLPTSEDQGDD